MSWSDLLPALRWQNSSTKLWDVVPRYIAIRGTVTDVGVTQDAFEPDTKWIDVAFRESPITDVGPNRRPYSEFNVCTSNATILQELFGEDFLKGVVGKTIEVEGETQGAYCRGLRGSIRVTLARQIRKVASAQFEPGTIPKFDQPNARQPSAPQPTAAESQAIRAAQLKQADEATRYNEWLSGLQQRERACAEITKDTSPANPDYAATLSKYRGCMTEATTFK